MNKLPLLLASVLAAAPAAQVHEGLMPFRSPQKDVDVPRELFHDLRVLVNRIEDPGGHEVYFDEDGREVCTHPAWQATREAVKGKLFNMAAVFGIVLRDSRHVNDRRLAAYGTFLLDDPEHVFELIAFFPGEPVRAIREAAFRRAIAYMRVHWPENKPSEHEGGPPEPRYVLEAAPFVGLLAVDDWRDHAQGLWFLREACRIRADAAKPILNGVRGYLPDLLTSERPVVREEARALLHAADPEHRDPPPPDAGDAALLAWLDAVVYDVFPPIRPVAEGRTDLYPSEDLDRIVEVGRDVLARKAIGGTYLGKYPSGQLYRGYRVSRVPEPLDKLRIPERAVITAINGQPVATGAEIITALQEWLKSRTSVMVEYVHEDEPRVMEYRLRQ